VLADSDQHAGATYELAGPGRYTVHDLTEVISGVLGRPVRADRINSEVLLKAAWCRESKPVSAPSPSVACDHRPLQQS